MWLYKLTHRRSAKAYIGTSVNAISKRVSRHLYAAKCGRKDMAIACAIRKHGMDAFSIECIGESSDYEELLRMEAEAIKSHGTLAPNGYNITDGGKGARRVCSPETRARIAARALESYRNKTREPWNKGKKTGPLSDDIRKKLSDASSRKGKPAWNKGMAHSEETKRKMRESAPKGSDRHNVQPLEFNGVVYESMRAACRGTGLTIQNLVTSLKNGIGRKLLKETLNGNKFD
ncbi:MAG TPA: NUMOD3 domain-containing DNA-binding protein [Terriglobales bacterium]|nr:NUMOD3 domain-containing DNA-binding protein [Terriglobales bacterium]